MYSIAPGAKTTDLPPVAASCYDVPAHASESTNIDDNDDPPLASTSRSESRLVARKGQDKGQSAVRVMIGGGGQRVYLIALPSREQFVYMVRTVRNIGDTN
jgi:hypothetical protein